MFLGSNLGPIVFGETYFGYQASFSFSKPISRMGSCHLGSNLGPIFDMELFPQPGRPAPVSATFYPNRTACPLGLNPCPIFSSDTHLLLSKPASDCAVLNKTRNWHLLGSNAGPVFRSGLLFATRQTYFRPHSPQRKR